MSCGSGWTSCCFTCHNFSGMHAHLLLRNSILIKSGRTTCQDHPVLAFFLSAKGTRFKLGFCSTKCYAQGLAWASKFYFNLPLFKSENLPEMDWERSWGTFPCTASRSIREDQVKRATNLKRLQTVGEASGCGAKGHLVVNWWFGSGGWNSIESAEKGSLSYKDPGVQSTKPRFHRWQVMMSIALLF